MLGVSEASVYSLEVAYDVSASSVPTGTDNPLVTVNADNKIVVTADFVLVFQTDQDVTMIWERGADEIFRVQGNTLGPRRFLAGDLVTVTTTAVRKLSISSLAAVPTPIASVDNLVALLKAGGGIEISEDNGRVLVETSEHSDNYERRAAWRADASFTAADFDGATVYTSRSFSLPTVGTDSFLGIWVSGSGRRVSEIEIDGISVLDRFTASPLMVSGVSGTLYRSNALCNRLLVAPWRWLDRRRLWPYILSGLLGVFSSPMTMRPMF